MEVLGPLRDAVVAHDGAPEPLELLFELVGDPLPVGLLVIEDRHLPHLEILEGVVGRDRALEVVGGADPEVVDRVRVRLADVEGPELRLGQPGVRLGWTDLDDAGRVGDRDRRLADVAVEARHHGDDGGVGEQLLDVLGALGRVVDAVDGVVLQHLLKLVGAPALVGILNRQEDAVVRRRPVGAPRTTHKAAAPEIRKSLRNFIIQEFK